MASSPFKSIIIAGATGTIGLPITIRLLGCKLFTVSALQRPSSTATLPTGLISRKVDLESHAELVEVLRGQDVLILTLNDAAAHLQPGIIEAAYQAGVRRVYPNEWAARLDVEGTGLGEMNEGKKGVVKLLEEKVKQAENEGKEFAWTGINNGVFFDWALYASFIDISLPPNRIATLWNGGNVKTTLTTLSTVSSAVLASLTSSESQTRNKLINIQSLAASQIDIILSLEKVTGEKWSTQHTTQLVELKKAGEALKAGNELEAFYTWIKAGIWGGKGVLDGTKEWNEVLGLKGEQLEDIVGRIVKGEEV